MRYVDEFRDPELITKASEEIRRLSDPARHYRIMEVCGGHTHAIYRFGLKDILPQNIELIHGPGCPVCVLPMGRIDDGLSIAQRAQRNLRRLRRHDARARRARAARSNTRRAAWTCASSIRPSDALEIARKNPDKQVMFFAIGFETTAPSTALTLMRAKSRASITSQSSAITSRSFPPSARFSIRPTCASMAFIGPGHVSTVIGCRPYEWIAEIEGKPDRHLRLRTARSAAVHRHAAAPARTPAKQSRKPVQARRSVGRQSRRTQGRWPKSSSCALISNGAASVSSRNRRLRIRDTYAEWDAERRFRVPGMRVTDPKAAQCGEVLKGVLKPAQCKLFGKECTPEHPDRRADGFIGRLMRSVLQLRTPEARW